MDEQNKAFLTNVETRLRNCELSNAKYEELFKHIMQRLDENNGKINRIDTRVEFLAENVNSRPSWFISILFATLIGIISALIGFYSA